MVWPPPRGTVGTAAERCSWRRGCFLSSPAIGRLLTQRCYYCSHPALPASTAALQMAFAGFFFFFLPHACLHLENQFSFCCSLRKHTEASENRLKMKRFFVMLQSPVHCFIFTTCAVLARSLSRSHTEVSGAKSSGIEDAEERYRPLVRNCNCSSWTCTKQVYVTR